MAQEIIIKQGKCRQYINQIIFEATKAAIDKSVVIALQPKAKIDPYGEQLSNNPWIDG